MIFRKCSQVVININLTPFLTEDDTFSFPKTAFGSAPIMFDGETTILECDEERTVLDVIDTEYFKITVLNGRGDVENIYSFTEIPKMKNSPLIGRVFQPYR